VGVIRAAWSSVSFLFYAGALTVLVSALWLLSILSDHYGTAAFSGWAALVLLFAYACAFSFRRAGRPLLAGLFAFVSIPIFVVFAVALEDWFGWLPKDTSPLHGFHLGLILIEILVVIHALWDLSLFKVPLLVLAAAGGGWYLVTDVLSSGGSWSATVSIVFGLVLLRFARAANPVYGFWLHVVAGLTIGGGVLWLWHTSDIDWIVIAIVGVLYVWLGGALERSSWTVLGAFGLFLSTTHYIDEWFGSLGLFPFFGLGEPPKHDWARPIGYAVLGFVFLLLGLALERRRRAAPAGA
jgi:hypothetical protein